MSFYAVGSYNRHSKIDARGAGISILRQHPDGRVETADSFPGIVNPTYLAWNAETRRLYCVGGTDSGEGLIGAFSVDDLGKLTLLDQRLTGVQPGCHICLFPEVGLAAAASYHDGRVTVHRISRDTVGPALATVVYRGSGPDASRQGDAHAHQVTGSPDGKHLYVCDLGSDRVWVHRVDALAAGSAEPASSLALPPGYGPRHLALDPAAPAFFLLCELKPRILAVGIGSGPGDLKIGAEYETVLEDADAAPAAVKIHPSGNTLAVSNRVDDTITVFSIDRSASGGTPVLLQIDYFGCGGKSPRDMEFSPGGDCLLVAHQDSHSIARKRFDSRSGRPEDGWDAPVETGAPVCVVSLG